MKSLSADSVSEADLLTLDLALASLPAGSQLRDAMKSIDQAMRSGRDVVVGSESDLVTPAIASRLIGVSRTHLYKLLDAGEIPFHSVGRDRRISLGDLRVFQDRQETLRKHVAERFAHPDRARDEALRSLAGRRSQA